MGQQYRLGEFEEYVLLAILHLEDDAYGVTIQEALEEAGRDASMGAIYTTLERLVRKGFVSFRDSEPLPERGGRSKRYYRVEGAGHAALTEQERGRVWLRKQLTPGFEGGTQI